MTFSKSSIETVGSLLYRQVKATIALNNIVSVLFGSLPIVVHSKQPFLTTIFFSVIVIVIGLSVNAPSV